MHNLRTVVSFEFIRTVRRKSFWVTTLAIPLLVAGIFALEFYSSKSASAKLSAGQEQFSLMVLDQSKLIPPGVLRAAKAQIPGTRQAGIEAVKAGQVDAFFYYPSDPVKHSIEVYARDVGIIKDGQYTNAATQLLDSGVVAGIGSPEKIAIVKGQASASLTAYADGRQVNATVSRIIAPGAFAVLLFVVMVLLGNQMLSSTTKEKENRVIEVMLTTVSSTSLIIGKIVAMIGVGFVQILAILVPILLAYAKYRQTIDLRSIVFDPWQMLVGALVFAGGFLVFTGILVAIGAAMPTAKEANRFFGMGMLSMLVPLYAAAAIVTTPDQPIVKFFTFFPTFAPLTLLIRNAVGNLSPFEATLGIIVVMASAAAALAIAVTSFRYGSLQYTRKITPRELFGIGPKA